MSRDVHSCTPQLLPSPPHLDSYTRALWVCQDRRHLFVTPWSYPYVVNEAWAVCSTIFERQCLMAVFSFFKSYPCPFLMFYTFFTWSAFPIVTTTSSRIPNCFYIIQIFQHFSSGILLKILYSVRFVAHTNCKKYLHVSFLHVSINAWSPRILILISYHRRKGGGAEHSLTTPAIIAIIKFNLSNYYMYFVLYGRH
jgi:hypothetical protein